MPRIAPASWRDFEIRAAIAPMLRVLRHGISSPSGYLQVIDAFFIYPCSPTSFLIALSEQVLHAPGYAEYFEAMFAGPKERFIDAAVLTARELQSIRADVLMVHGRDDLPFPAAPLTQALARSLPQADVCLLARCGHSPALEQPRKLLALARMFFGAA